MGVDRYGRRLYRCGSFHVTQWKFDAPMVSRCWRVTHMSDEKVCCFEGDTLAEIREWFLQ